MPDIIVHGSTSFLGKHFIRKLVSEKTGVIVLARKSSDVSQFKNLPGVELHSYSKSLEEIPVGLINSRNPVYFEFAWNGVFGTERNSENQISVNVPLIESSVNFAKSIGAKHWVGIGSQAEYGNLDKRISESDECHPTTLYGKAKLTCSHISAELCKQYKIEHSWLRLFSVYGPDDNHEWLIPHLIKEMLKGNEINVTKGEQYWDYLYIDDISRALIKLKDTKGVGIANLGSGKAIQVKEIINKIRVHTNSKSQINFGAIPYREDQVMLMEADITKLSNHLNWIPEISIDEGLKSTVDFIVNAKRN